MNEDQLNALMFWVDAKIKSIIDSDCIGASLSERELREELKNIMLGDDAREDHLGQTHAEYLQSQEWEKRDE